MKPWGTSSDDRRETNYYHSNLFGRHVVASTQTPWAGFRTQRNSNSLYARHQQHKPMCKVKVAVDLDVEIIRCDIVDVNCLGSPEDNCPSEMLAHFEHVLDGITPIPGDVKAGPGTYTSRRTISCGLEQFLEVTLDVTYRVSIKGCSVKKIEIPELEYELPIPYIDPSHLRR